MSLDLLAFGPHPDDVELFCGGLVAKSVAQGHAVGIVDLTRGEAASRGTPEVRAREAAAAAALLGVRVRETLGLRDGAIGPDKERPGDDAYTAELVRALRSHRPKVVLSPWREARHPDHAAASALIDRAVFLTGLRSVLPESEPHWVSQVLYYVMRVEPAPSFYVDISAYADAKDAAIACHASQVGERAEGEAKTLVGSASALGALRAREAAWGARIGVARAEAFVARDPLAIDDVVATTSHAKPSHFRAGTGGT